MPKLQIKATELVDTDVDFVSLVKRGANRLPFRITKEDNNMLDLHKIGRALFKKADQAPEVVAAVVPAGADLNKVAEVFKGAGMDTQLFTKSERDGVVTITRKDAETAEDTVIVKTGGQIGLVVSGLKKAFDGYDARTSDFSTAIKAQGFYPSFCTAKDVLSSVVYVALNKANTPAEAAEAITKSVDDFKDYVGTLASALPASAFYVDRNFYEGVPVGMYKADETKTEPAKEEAKKADEPAEAEPADEPKKAEKADEEDGKKKPPFASADDEDDANKDKGADVKKDEVADAAAVAAAAAVEPAAEPAQRDELAELKKSQGDMIAAITELQKTVTEVVSGLKDDVKKDLASLTSRVDQVAEQAQKTDAALNGTVFADAGGDQPSKTQKADDEKAPPLLDTAYDRRNAA